MILLRTIYLTTKYKRRKEKKRSIPQWRRGDGKQGKGEEIKEDE
jgi:hypothetical protein